MRKSRAFTLFELLVAMLIVVILVGTLAATMSLAFKEKRAAEETVDAVRDIQTIGDYWVSDVSTALPPASQPSTATATSTAPASNGLSAISGLGLNGMSGTLGGDLSGTSEPLAEAFEVTPSAFLSLSPDLSPRLPSAVMCGHIIMGWNRPPTAPPPLVRRVDFNLLADNPDPQPPGGVLISSVRSLSFQLLGRHAVGSIPGTRRPTPMRSPMPSRMQIILEPLRPNGEMRMIQRTATVWCAAPPADTTGTSTTTTGGLTGGILGN